MEELKKKTLKDLNDSQKEAVEILSGPLLILAGAGSGKTKCLTHRVCNLIINGISPEKILAVTFTNKAANEMKSRIEKMILGEIETKGIPLIGTFHSLCVRILRSHIEYENFKRKKDFIIFDTNDTQTLMKQILKDAKIDEKELKPKQILSRISSAKSLLITPEDYLSCSDKNPYEEKIALLYQEYEKRLCSHNALDFDDLLQKTVILLTRNKEIREYYQKKWDHLLVDEYQDTNTAQYNIVKILTEKHKNICVIGDDHQSIYSFRGADFQNILNFTKDFPSSRVIKLEQNYRSTGSILENANSLISHNETGHKKFLWTKNESGDPIEIIEVNDEKEEANVIAEKIQSLTKNENFEYSDCAILYRTNAQSRSLEEGFMRNGIPYQIVGGTKFFERMEIKDIIAYLRIIASNKDDISFLRIINIPSRKIGPGTLETLKKNAKQNSVSLLEAVEKNLLEDIQEKKQETLINFKNLIDSYKEKSKTMPLSVLIEELIEEIKYEEYLEDGSIEGESRKENVRELLSVAEKYDSSETPLQSFLEGVSLIADIDNYNETQNSVTMMTVHTSKGLEFPIVFLPGWEDGIFPHINSSFSKKDIEEERRLGYVAITRARKKCFILYTNERMMFGRRDISSPSRFLSELSLSHTKHEKINKISREQHSLRTHSAEEKVKIYDIPSSREEAIFGITQNKTGFQIGQKILHRDFGEGTIIQTSGDVIAVAFASIGMKKLVASISPITIINDSKNAE